MQEILKQVSVLNVGVSFVFETGMNCSFESNISSELHTIEQMRWLKLKGWETSNQFSRSNASQLFAYLLCCASLSMCIRCFARVMVFSSGFMCVWERERALEILLEFRCWSLMNSQNNWNIPTYCRTNFGIQSSWISIMLLFRALDRFLRCTKSYYTIDEMFDAT